MYQITDSYRESIEQDHTERISGTITLNDGAIIPFSDDVIMNIVIDNQCINGEELEFGAVYSGQLSFKLKNSTDTFRLYGAKVELQHYVNEEPISMGVYYITEAKRQQTFITITALDVMSKTDVDLTGEDVSFTPWELLKCIAKSTGIVCENTQSEIEAMPNGTEKLYRPAESIGTCRNYLSQLSQILCGFTTATRTGGFKIVQFSTAPDYSVNYDLHFSTTLSDYMVRYTQVATVVNGVTISSEASTNDGFLMYIENNVFLQGTDEDVQRKINAIMNCVENIRYIPSEVTASSMPFLECGDMVQYSINGITYDSLITSYIWKYHAQCEYYSRGKNPGTLTYKASDYVVRKIDTLYYLSNLSTEPVGGEWSVNAPEKTAGKYIWQKTVTTYTNGKISESEPVCISGADGEKGVSIKNVSTYYILASEMPEKPGTLAEFAEWETTEPDYTEGNTDCLYYANVTTFEDDSIIVSDVSISSNYEAAKIAYEKAIEAQEKADDAKETADTANEGVTTLKTYIRESEKGIEVGKEGGTYKALVNSEGSFDILDSEGNVVTFFKNGEVNFGGNTGYKKICFGDGVYMTSNKPEGEADPLDVYNFRVEADQNMVYRAYVDSGHWANLQIAARNRDGSSYLGMTTYNNDKQNLFFMRTEADGRRSISMASDTVQIDYTNELLLGTKPLDDFVISQGTNGVWFYRKWESGIAECWRTNNYKDVVCNQDRKGWFTESSSHYNIYPVAFIEKPSCIINIASSISFAMVTISDGDSITRTPSFRVAYPSSATLSTVDIVIYTIGRWK